MGTMTLNDFRTELKYILANRNDTGTTEARLTRWINKTYRHMTRPRVFKHIELRKRYDLQLVAGQNEYSLTQATVGHKVLGVVDVTYYMGNPISESLVRRNLKPRRAQWMNERTKPPGSPQAYTFDSAGGELLVLNTLPTTSEAGHWVRVWHYAQPDVLAAATDTTVLGDYFDDVLLLGAQFFAEWEIVSKAEATATGQLYQQMLNEDWEAFELSAEDDGQLVEFESETYKSR